MQITFQKFKEYWINPIHIAAFRVNAHAKHDRCNLLIWTVGSDEPFVIEYENARDAYAAMGMTESGLAIRPQS